MEETQTTPTPTIQNLVSSANLGCKLDLKHITLHAANAEYNPKKFGAVIMRIRDPRTTCLIFHTGRIVVSGAKTDEQSACAARKYARIIQKIGFPVKFSEFKINNIVASCDLQFIVKLELLNMCHPNITKYEPELFPGLLYKFHGSKMVILVFISGKIVITGDKKVEKIQDAFDKLYPVVCKFKKT